MSFKDLIKKVGQSFLLFRASGTQATENSAPAPVKPKYNIDPEVVNTVYSETGNVDTPRESAAMYASIVNRANRLKEHTGREYSPTDVVKIPDQYLGRTNKQFENAQTGNMDKLSGDKYNTVKKAIDQIDTLRQEIGDYDSFSKGLPAGVKEYKKVGEHLFYKMPTGLRTK